MFHLDVSDDKNDTSSRPDSSRIVGDGKKNNPPSKEYISGDVKFIVSIVTAVVVIIAVAILIPRVSVSQAPFCFYSAMVM